MRVTEREGERPRERECVRERRVRGERERERERRERGGKRVVRGTYNHKPLSAGNIGSHFIWHTR